MYVHVGTELYGKVDRVPGLFHVATEFVHVWFLPLVPRRSFLVREETADGKARSPVRIPLSSRSILIAWTRTVLSLIGLVLPIFSVIHYRQVQQGIGREPSLSVVFLAISAMCFLGLCATYRFTRASPLRALELGARAKIPPEVIARYFTERLTPADEDYLVDLSRAAEG
jgi:hypothetical protein